ncbi:histidine kinase [Chitinophaga japonensis]|uniref:Histidine kinase n=2 Tax=Chitinophaga japonensis TaxID=104662 RepID=A0A562SMC0_CHIJA|nr:histidine kinase [Chitinophaga japonensis]
MPGIFLFSCRENTVELAAQRRAAGLAMLKEAVPEARKLPSAEERLVYWEQLLNSDPYRGDSVLEARIHYELAGVYYAKNDLDSIKWHLQSAWDLMERQQGYGEIMVLIYSGEGNIATMEQQVHQASYYFNQAARILLADTSLDMTALQKANIFLATAQADAHLYQYDQSRQWNHMAAQVLAPGDPDQARLLFRAYDQLALHYLDGTGSNTDSAWTYIRWMEKLLHGHPQSIDPQFLYDRKSIYYDRTEQPDSALVYNRNVLAICRSDVASGKALFGQYANLFKSYVNMAVTFTRLSRHDSAGFYLDRATAFIKAYEQYLDDTDYILYRKSLIAHLFETGRSRDAYDQFETLVDSYETLSENKYAQAIAEMSTIYALQAKEKSVLQLNEQVFLVESRLRQNRLLLVITTLSALLAIALAVLLYFIQQQRKLKEEKARVQLQKNAIELEQRLLRTQMEPHFIFNTLSALQSYVRLDEKEKALKYLKQFSRLLRSSLELSRESLAPLDEEINTLEYYLSLQQMRYDDAFDYRVSRPESGDTDHLLIPPMLVQPFVENAIIHGMKGTGKKGRIDIALHLLDHSLRVTITDNGPGIQATAGKPAREKKSLSTTISRERLEMLAREKGLKAGVTITDRRDLPGENRGTLVELIIPVQESNV